VFAVDDSDLTLQVEIGANPYEHLDVARRKDWWLLLRREHLHVIPDC
jgi:hypothetical protein